MPLTTNEKKVREKYLRDMVLENQDNPEIVSFLDKTATKQKDDLLAFAEEKKVKIQERIDWLQAKIDVLEEELDELKSIEGGQVEPIDK